MGVDSWDDTAENVTSRISGDSISSRIDDDGASPVTPKVNAFDSDGISLDSGNIEAMLNPLTTFNIDCLPFCLILTTLEDQCHELLDTLRRELHHTRVYDGEQHS